MRAISPNTRPVNGSCPVVAIAAGWFCAPSVRRVLGVPFACCTALRPVGAAPCPEAAAALAAGAGADRAAAAGTLLAGVVGVPTATDGSTASGLVCSPAVESDAVFPPPT